MSEAFESATAGKVFGIPERRHSRFAFGRELLSHVVATT